MATRSVTYVARLSLLSSAWLAAAAPSLAQSACPRGALPAYAHNDYINPSPLHDALALGFVGVEADVFLVNGVLRLGHERRAAERGTAFEAQYLEPLRSLVARCGSLTVSGRPFLLNVELKEKDPAAFDTLMVLLARYANMFTTVGREHDAPVIQVVLVGWSPSDAVPGPSVAWGRQARLRRDDERALETTDPTVRLISLDYGKTMGRWWVTPGKRKRWLATIRATRDAFPAQRIRAYDVPVKERVYRELLGAGVDLIGSVRLERSAQLLHAIADSTR